MITLEQQRRAISAAKRDAERELRSHEDYPQDIKDELTATIEGLRAAHETLKMVETFSQFIKAVGQ